MNSLQALLDFLSELQKEKIHFNLECVRDSIMVIIPCPGKYYEVEFFADGHIEVQTFGPSTPVQAVTLRDITEQVIRDVNG